MITVPSYKEKEWILQNSMLSLSYSERGGVLSEVIHVSSSVNPLSFQLPRPDHPDSFYKGHFICAPRWGDPTIGEKQAGVIKHGDIGTQLWKTEKKSDTELSMNGVSLTDQIMIHRTVRLGVDSSVCNVTETLTNTSTVFRPVNLVQHPTLAAPFLDQDTLVFSNGQSVKFPDGSKPVENIHSFFLSPDETGWIVAVDKKSSLLFGYCWSGKHFPWIHHWIHEVDNRIVYRGLEFGTAALHISWEELKQGYQWEFQQQPACLFLDSLESRTFPYFLFMTSIPDTCETVDQVVLNIDHLYIKGNGTDMQLSF